MCSPVRCRTCNKTTWSGCGDHIDAVKALVPPEEWCDGQHSAAEAAEAKSRNPSLFARLFGR